jgi:hypothetical protein
VTFTGVPASLDRYDLHLTSSAKWFGFGEVSRQLTLTNLSVTFRNPAGLTQTVAVPSTAVTFATKVAVLAPTSQSITAYVPSQAGTLSPITVSVPAGFGTSGSTATISAGQSNAGSVTTASSDPLPNQIPNGRSVILLSIKAGADLSDQGPSSVAASIGTWTSAEGTMTFPDGTKVSVYLPPIVNVDPGGDPGDVFNTPPATVCGGISGDTTCFYTGAGGQNGSLVYSAAYLNLSDRAIQLYGNHWLYRRSAEPVYVDWQQASGRVANTLGCVGGSIRLAITAFTNESRQLLQATSPWNVSQFKISELAEPSLESTVSLSWGNNSLSNTGIHSPQVSYSGTQGDGWTQGTWTKVAGSNDTEQMITASEFVSGTTGYPKAMTLEDSHAWTILYEKTC